MKKPRIFIMGEVFDMNTITKEELQKKLQEKIDTFGFPEPCKVIVTDNEDDGFDDIYYMIGVRRGYGIGRWIYLRLAEEGFLLEGDANIITGNTHGYTVNKLWPKSEFLKDFSGQNSVRESEFSKVYDRICKKEGADVPEDTEFVQSEHGYFQWIVSY